MRSKIRNYRISKGYPFTSASSLISNNWLSFKRLVERKSRHKVDIVFADLRHNEKTHLVDSLSVFFSFLAETKGKRKITRRQDLKLYLFSPSLLIPFVIVSTKNRTLLSFFFSLSFTNSLVFIPVPTPLLVSLRLVLQFKGYYRRKYALSQKGSVSFEGLLTPPLRLTFTRFSSPLCGRYSQHRATTTTIVLSGAFSFFLSAAKRTDRNLAKGKIRHQKIEAYYRLW